MGDIFAGRYELVDPLGEGGSGTVWRVWDHKQGRYCAAKVLRQVDATSLLRFIREQSLRLEHQHVLAPTGWAGEDDKVLFTMPMIRGGVVSTLIGDFGPLPPRLVVLLLDQLLTALEVLHREGIVHRDVKPANLLLDATGRGYPNLWLGDFGIAAGVDEPRLTTGPYALGTHGYLAPECLTHGWDPDPRADLYSAGMCAVEMITGMKPDRGTHAAEALAEAELPYELPQALVDVVHRLAAPSISARFEKAEDARRRLWDAGLMPQNVPAEEILGEVELFDHIPPLPEGWGGQSQQAPLAAAEQGEPTSMMGMRSLPTAAVPHQTPQSSGHEVPDREAPDYGVPDFGAPEQDAPSQQHLSLQPPFQQAPPSHVSQQAATAPAHSAPQHQNSVGPGSQNPSGRVRAFAIPASLLGLGLLLLLFTIWLATY